MDEKTRKSIYNDLKELITTTVNTQRLWSNWGNNVATISADRLRRSGTNEKEIKDDLRYINSVIIDIGYEFAKVPLPKRDWQECGKNARKVLNKSQLNK